MAKKTVEQRLKAIEEAVFVDGHSIDEAVIGHAVIGRQFAATVGDFAHDMSTIYGHFMSNLGHIYQLYGGEVQVPEEDIKTETETEDSGEKTREKRPHLTVIHGDGDGPSTTDSA